MWGTATLMRGNKIRRQRRDLKTTMITMNRSCSPSEKKRLITGGALVARGGGGIRGTRQEIGTKMMIQTIIPSLVT
jgi:hypothetical protein